MVRNATNMSATLSIDDSAELLAIRRRKIELKRERLEVMRNNGLAFYCPHDKQAAFHEAGAKFKMRMVRAGNRFGKSQMGCAEDVAWMMGERSWYPKGHAARNGGIPQHPIKLLTITTDWDKVDEIWTSERGEGAKVWKYLPRERCKVRRNHSGAIDTIETDINGRKSLWRFDTVKSFMANPQGSESSDWDAIHVDEPCPEAMYKSAARGLMDRNGATWFTLTPLREFWINDLFFPQDTGGKPRDGVWAVSGSTYDNPFLSKEAIVSFEQSLTEDERQCRIQGIPLNLSGLVYKEFKWERHVLKEPPEGWDTFVSPPKNYPILFFIDPHPQTPHAVLFCSVLPTGRRVYFHDIFSHCSIADLASQIHAFIDGRFVLDARIDPFAYINDPITESNMAEEFIRHGIFVEKATKALAHGILKVKAELKKDNILFSPYATRSLWEIQRYCWDEKDNRPVDKDDHMMENLYRTELSEPRFITPQRSVVVPDLIIDRANLRFDDMDLSLN